MSEDERNMERGMKGSRLFLEYVEDAGLTEVQQDLKWSIYAECEWFKNRDIKEALKSVLNDLKKIERDDEKDGV